MVLLSDHELNPSTFAVRVCASTGGSLPAALLAGVATLSGTRHGGVAPMAKEALQSSIHHTLEQFLEENAEKSPYSFGFGHPLYPNGDPRASYLFDLVPEGATVRRAVERLSDRVSCAADIDIALAAISHHFGWPDDAATTVFTVGRTVGWAAHAIEQARSGSLIRPRAFYQSENVEL